MEVSSFRSEKGLCQMERISFDSRKVYAKRNESLFDSKKARAKWREPLFESKKAHSISKIGAYCIRLYVYQVTDYMIFTRWPMRHIFLRLYFRTLLINDSD